MFWNKKKTLAELQSEEQQLDQQLRAEKLKEKGRLEYDLHAKRVAEKKAKLQGYTPAGKFKQNMQHLGNTYGPKLVGAINNLGDAATKVGEAAAKPQRKESKPKQNPLWGGRLL